MGIVTNGIAKQANKDSNVSCLKNKFQLRSTKLDLMNKMNYAFCYKNLRPIVM